MAHQDNCVQISSRGVSRRTLVAGIAAGAGSIALGPRDARAAGDMGPVAPPSTVTSPPRDFGPNAAPTTYFTDPDVLTVDPSFASLSRIPRSSVYGPGRYGRRGRLGVLKAAISCGATFPTTGKCDGWRTTAA